MTTDNHGLKFLLGTLRKRNSPITKIAQGITTRATTDMLVGRADSKDIGLLTLMTECFEVGRLFERQEWNQLANAVNDQSKPKNVPEASPKVGNLDGPTEV